MVRELVAAGYTEVEKQHIASKYLVKKQREANGLADQNLDISDNALLSIVRHYTKEAGVRNLEREIATVCRKIAKDYLASGRTLRIRRASSRRSAPR